jgi:hypothetical protein
LLCHLRGERDARQALTGAMGGSLFENVVFGELWRAFTAVGRTPAIHYFRTAAGHEVDFLVEVGTRLLPVEVKLASTPRPEMAAGVLALEPLLGARLLPGVVVTLGGPDWFPLARLRALAWRGRRGGGGPAWDRLTETLGVTDDLASLDVAEVEDTGP